MANTLGPDQNEHLCSKLHEMLSSCQWKEAENRLDRDHQVQIVDSSFQNVEEKYDFLCKYSEQLPIETKFEDVRGYLALYIAVEFGAPFELVRKLIKSNPEAISKKCVIDGVYPLHFACAPKENNPSTLTEKLNKKIDLNQVDVIKYLFRKSKKIIYERNNEGNSTPFHLLLEHSPPVDLVQYIIEHAPPPESQGQPVEKKTDIQGRLPIHIALDNDADSDVIMCLLKRYKECVKIKQEDPECLLLHLAASRGCSEKVLLFLLKEYPDALVITGAHKDTPFHLVFYQYERKFTPVEGKSTHNGHCNVERMIRLMVYYLYQYYEDMQKSKQVTKNNVAKILLHKENYFEDKKNKTVTKETFHDMMWETHLKFSLPKSLLNYINSIDRDKQEWAEQIPEGILSDAAAHDKKSKRKNKAKPGVRKPAKNTINPRKKQKTNTKKIPSTRPITKNTTSTIDHRDEKSLSGISILNRIMREDEKSPGLNLEPFSRFPSPIHESPHHSITNEDDSPDSSDEENRAREYARKHFKEDENIDLRRDDKYQVEDSSEKENISMLGEREMFSVSSGESKTKQTNGRNETENKQPNSENSSEYLSPIHKITPCSEGVGSEGNDSENEIKVQHDNEESEIVNAKSPQRQYGERRTIHIENQVDNDLRTVWSYQVL